MAELVGRGVPDGGPYRPHQISSTKGVLDVLSGDKLNRQCPLGLFHVL
jgi:hypothetical protein